jgi:putative peptidoglycan lipid II flippase
MILAQPLVALLFERGAFTAASTDITQAALLYYAIGLPAHAAIEILSRGFYALGDTRTPVGFAIVSLVVNLVLCAALVGPLEVRGLALALSVATIAEALLLAWTLRGRIEGIDLPGMAQSIGRTAVASALMAAVVAAYLFVLDQAGHSETSSLLDAFLALAGSAALGGAVFLVAARALRSEEAETLLSRLPRLPRRSFA